MVVAQHPVVRQRVGHHRRVERVVPEVAHRGGVHRERRRRKCLQDRVFPAVAQRRGHTHPGDDLGGRAFLPRRVVLGEAIPAALERPVMDDLVEAEGGGERTQPVLAGALRPRHVESLQFADVVVLAARFGLHDLLNHHGRTEIRVAQLGQRLVARPRIHDPPLAGCPDAGQERRPLLGCRVVATAARLRRADPRVVGERVDLPDDRDLRPVPVVRRWLPTARTVARPAPASSAGRCR